MAFSTSFLLRKGVKMAMPEKKFRAGAVAATIWKNQGQSKKTGEPIEYRTIQIDRRYVDKNEEWKSTNSFRLNDLPKVKVVAEEAYKYLVLKDESRAPLNETPNTSEQPVEEEIVM